MYESREEAFIVSDLCLGGDLLDWMIDDPKESVDEEILAYGAQHVDGCRSCHRAGLAHLDIKPENFCLEKDSDSELVLVDFGSAEPLLVHRTRQPVRTRNISTMK